MLQFPKFLEDLLLDYLKQTYLPQKKRSSKKTTFNEKDFKFFAKGARLLSEAYTKDRGSLSVNYLNNPVYRSGYLLYFLPVNFLKVVRIFQELQKSELTSGNIRILDIGAGPGTAMLGMMAFYAEAIRQKKVKDAWLDFTLIDQNYSILKDALYFHQGYREHLASELKGFQSVCSVKNYDLRRGSLKRFLRNFRYHVIILGNVLNEFPNRDTQVEFIETIIKDHLEPKTGKLIIFEPALKKPSRDLQYVRDQIVVVKKQAFVYSPCLHQEICPLNLINKKDWCHFYYDWQRPKFIEKVDRLIGNKKNWLACSYLLLSKKERELKSLYRRPDQSWRVISNQMPSNGKRELILCGPPGRYRLTKLDKDTTSTNKMFNQVQRGDVVEMDVGAKGKAYRVDGEYRVEKKDSIKVLKKI